MKTKHRGCVEVFQDDNDKLTMRDDVFELGELVGPYQIAPINNLEENLNFRITENIFIYVDAEELNDVLSSSWHTQVDEDGNDKINIQDCDRDEDESIDKEEENFY